MLQPLQHFDLSHFYHLNKNVTTKSQLQSEQDKQHCMYIYIVYREGNKQKHMKCSLLPPANEDRGKLMFYACLSFCSQEGGGLPNPPPWMRTPPPQGLDRPPRMQTPLGVGQTPRS